MQTHPRSFFLLLEVAILSILTVIAAIMDGEEAPRRVLDTDTQIDRLHGFDLRRMPENKLECLAFDLKPYP